MKINKHIYGIGTHDFSPELIALIAGIKPVFRTYSVPEAEYEKITKSLEVYNLYCEKSDFRIEDIKISRPIVNLKVSEEFGNVFVYVSKKKKLVALAKKFDQYSRDEDLKKFGLLMGYPLCCVESWIEKHEKRDVSNFPNYWEYETYKATKNPSFLLNNLIKGDPFYLISHRPCSYDCERSREYARRLLKYIEETNNDYAENIKYMLKLPVLKFNREGAGLRFVGRCEKDTIIYSDVMGDSKLKALFEKGNKVVVGKEKINLFKDNELISEIKKEDEYDGVIFKFD